MKTSCSHSNHTEAGFLRLFLTVCLYISKGFLEGRRGGKTDRQTDKKKDRKKDH